MLEPDPLRHSSAGACTQTSCYRIGHQVQVSVTVPDGQDCSSDDHRYAMTRYSVRSGLGARIVTFGQLLTGSPVSYRNRKVRRRGVPDALKLASTGTRP